jgi:phosphatidylserine synthase
MICFGLLPAAIGFSIGLTHWYEAAALFCMCWRR